MEMLRRREAKIESLKPEQNATYALLFYLCPSQALSRCRIKIPVLEA
jgi:hypothetical protein